MPPAAPLPNLERLKELVLEVGTAPRAPRLNDEQHPSNGASITRTMLKTSVDRSESIALHDQVAAEIRRAISEGEARPGECLPLAKDIAAVLGVNKNTVLRALHNLREEKLLDFTRGRGITVAGTVEKSDVLRRARELVEFARQCGHRRTEVISMIETLT
jgi:GntR family transcriptional regulator